MSSAQISVEPPVDGSLLLQSMLFSDYAFHVGPSGNETTVTGHKCFLSSASPILAQMIFENQRHINDMDARIVKIVFQFIYTGRIVINVFEDALAICRAANKFLLQELENRCLQYIRENLTAEVVCRSYEIARLCNNTALENECLEIMRRRTVDVLNTDIERANLDTIVVILSLPYLNIDSEMQLFDAILRYSRLSQGHHLSISRVAVKKIRFLTMTAEEFSKGPARSSLLSNSDSLAILMNIVNRNSVAMPMGFTDTRLLRHGLAILGSVEPSTAYRFEVNFNELYNTTISSHTFFIGNLPWRILMNRDSEDDSYLTVYVWCNSNVTLDWSYYVQYKVSILSQVVESESIDRICRDFIIARGCNGRGFRYSWDTISNPERGYLRNGTIIINVEIDVEGQSSNATRARRETLYEITQI